MADRVAVMYGGRIVEQAPVAASLRGARASLHARPARVDSRRRAGRRGSRRFPARVPALGQLRRRVRLRAALRRSLRAVRRSAARCSPPRRSTTCAASCMAPARMNPAGGARDAARRRPSPRQGIPDSADSWFRRAPGRARGRRRDVLDRAPARRSASSANPARARRRPAAASCGSSSRRPARFASRTWTSARSRRAELRRARRHFQIVFQDPYSSLNPRMRVGAIVEEPLVIHRIGTRDERRARVRQLFELVGLDPAGDARSIRTSSAAASASASAWRARSRSSRRSSSATSPCRRSTSRCRRRSSICCSICRSGSD